MAKEILTKRINVDLTEEEYREFKIIADENAWSDKRLGEHIIRGFLKAPNKTAIIKLGKKEIPRS